jgi:peptidoglycan/LPS O-acetylase OafA/YrhL
VTPATSAERAQAAAGMPRTVLTAAVVQAIEAAGILVASAMAAIATAGGHSYQTASGVAITLIGVGTAIVLALVARALRRARRWSRTPGMLTQLFIGIVAIYLLQSGRLEWGIPAITLAIVGMAALLAPASVHVLTPGRMEKHEIRR